MRILPLLLALAFGASLTLVPGPTSPGPVPQTGPIGAPPPPCCK